MDPLAVFDRDQRNAIAMLRERTTGVVVFMGRVNDPSQTRS